MEIRNKISTNKNAIIYCRVSTKEQVETKSLSLQEKLCRGFASQNNYKILKAFIEKGQSAKTANRTELQKLLSYCKASKDKIDAVIVHKLDRMARDSDDYKDLRRELRKYGAEIKSTTEFFEDTPAGRFMENIIAEVAQFDNDVRAERSIGGMKEAVEEGRYVWTAPAGYDNIKIDKLSTIAPNSQASVVRKAFEMVSKNVETVEEVRIKIMLLGLKSRRDKPISKSQFYAMLHNKLYSGIIKKFGNEYKGTFKAIISEELYNNVQYIMNHRTLRSGKYIKENTDFPLRRFIYHPSGKRLTGSWCKGRYKHYPYYRFPIKGLWYTKFFLESHYMEYLDNFSLNEKTLKHLKYIIERKFVDGVASREEDTKNLEFQIAKLKNQQTQLVQKNMDGIINDILLKDQLKLIDIKLLELNKEFQALNQIRPDVGGMIEYVYEYLKNPSKIWVKSDLQNRLKLQWFHFPKGLVFDGNKFGTTEKLFVLKDKRVNNTLNSYNVPSVVLNENNLIPP